MFVNIDSILGKKEYLETYAKLMGNSSDVLFCRYRLSGYSHDLNYASVLVYRANYYYN